MRKLIVISILLTIPFFLSGSTITVETPGTGYTQDTIINKAYSLLGTPYVWGGISPEGVDCSGLIYYVFNETISAALPRQVEALRQSGQNTGKKLKPADLLFFDTDGKGTASHVGIAIGGNKFIHAASAGKKTGVIISSLDEKYYKARYLGAKRLLSVSFPLIAIDLDHKKKETSIESLLVPGTPVYFKITSKLDNTEFITFKAVKDGKTIITRRFRNHLTDQSASTWFIPDEGHWTVILSDGIKDELAVLNFK